jgi:hypothetical protein
MPDRAAILDDFPFGALKILRSDGQLLYANAAAYRILNVTAEAPLNGWKAVSAHERENRIHMSSQDGKKLCLAGSWVESDSARETRLFVMHLAPLSERMWEHLRQSDKKLSPGGMQMPYKMLGYPVPFGSAETGRAKPDSLNVPAEASWQAACFRALAAAVDEGDKAVVLWDALTGAISSASGHLERWRAPVEAITHISDWTSCIHPANREAAEAAHGQMTKAPAGHELTLTYHLLGRYKGIKAVRERSLRLPSPGGTALVLTIWEACKLPPLKPRPEDITPQQHTEKAFRALGKEHGFARVLYWKRQDDNDFALWASWRGKQLKPVVEYPLPGYLAERLAAALLPGGIRNVYTPADLPGMCGLNGYGVSRFMVTPVGDTVSPLGFLLLCVHDDWFEPETDEWRRLESLLTKLKDKLENNE